MLAPVRARTTPGSLTSLKQNVFLPFVREGRDDLLPWPVGRGTMAAQLALGSRG
jgi:hypothetical protein